MTKKKDDDATLVERALKAGLGLISLGEEKLGKLTDELAKRGDKYIGSEDSTVSHLISALSDPSETFKETSEAIKEKGSELSKALQEKSSELSKALQEKGGDLKDVLAKEAKSILQKVNFATKSEFEELRAEVADLKKQLAKKKRITKKKTTKK